MCTQNKMTFFVGLRSVLAVTLRCTEHDRSCTIRLPFSDPATPPSFSSRSPGNITLMSSPPVGIRIGTSRIYVLPSGYDLIWHGLRPGRRFPLQPISCGVFPRCRLSRSRDSLMPHLYEPAAWWYWAVPLLTTTAPQPNTLHHGSTKQSPLT